jgi:cyanophycin synthetase
VPVVVKPYDGNHGRGVSLNLMTQADVEAAYALAHRKGGRQRHRREIHSRQRTPPAGGGQKSGGRRTGRNPVGGTGDGVSTIDQLAQQQINTDPRRGVGEDFPLNVVIPSENAEVILELERVGLTPQSIPSARAKNTDPAQRQCGNDITDQMHPSVAATAALAARVVGLDIAGIDMVLEDIGKAHEPSAVR